MPRRPGLINWFSLELDRAAAASPDSNSPGEVHRFQRKGSTEMVYRVWDKRDSPGQMLVEAGVRPPVRLTGPTGALAWRSLAEMLTEIQALTRR